jgi:hypothetical protein
VPGCFVASGVLELESEDGGAGFNGRGAFARGGEGGGDEVEGSGGREGV